MQSKKGQAQLLSMRKQRKVCGGRQNCNEGKRGPPIPEGTRGANTDCGGGGSGCCLGLAGDGSGEAAWEAGDSRSRGGGAPNLGNGVEPAGPLLGVGPSGVPPDSGEGGRWSLACGRKYRAFVVVVVVFVARMAEEGGKQH